MDQNNTNVYKIELEDKEVILIGTAHVSQQSADDVEAVVRDENPDAIAVELDEKRYKIINMPEEERRKGYSFEEIMNMISKGKLGELIMMSVLSIPQRRLSEKFNIKPGAEMIKGIELSEELDKELLLIDRDVNITISRLANSIPFWMIPLLGISAITSLIAVEFITPEHIERLRSDENLEQTIEMARRYAPEFVGALIDERDKMLSYNILKADYKKIVAIVGAGHINGIQKYLEQGVTDEEAEEINKEKKFEPFKNLFGM